MKPNLELRGRAAMRLIRYKVVLLAFIEIAITGCQDVIPMTAPTPTDIAQEASILSHAALANQPATYVKVGYGLVERECGTFFDALDKAQDQASFVRQELTLGGAGAAGILAAVKAGVIPITITGIAVPLAANTIENYQNFALITPYPDETAILVRSALKTFRDNASSPTDIYDAVALVQSYAAICTYSGIHQLAKQALAKAQTTDHPQPPPAPPPPPAFGAPQPPPSGAVRVHIPNVVVQ